MSVTATPVFTQTPNAGGGSIATNSTAGALGSDSTGTVATIYTAGTNGSRITALLLSQNDTAANNIFIYIKSGSNVWPIGEVQVALSAGATTNTPNVDGLNSSTVVGLPIDNNGKRYIHLPASAVLKMAMVTASSNSGKTLYATVMAEDY